MLHPRTMAAPVILSILLGACGGDDLLAPPDGTACTRGGIAPGDSVTGHLGAASCEGLTVTNWAPTTYESWTLEAKKNTAYVIRAYHIQDGDGDDTWDGDLVAYGRNDADDQVFLTGWWGQFGASNANGGEHREMFIVAPEDETISLRLEAPTVDSGSYALTVEACPAIPLTNGVAVEGVNVSAGCLSYGLNAGAPERVTFGTFESDTAAGTAVTVLRTSGASLLYGRVTGQNFDTNCWISDCTWTSLGALNDTLMGTVLPGRPGRLSLIIGVDTAGTTTVDLLIDVPVAPAPPAVPGRVRNPFAR